MLDRDMCYLSIAQAAAGLRRKEFSPVELTKACLDRIQAIDGKLHAFITLTDDLALSQAHQAEKELLGGVDRGPLHGIPIALKDLYATKGIRTTAHSRVLLDWVPDEDATAVVRLREAGAVLLGKLAMHEFAFGGPTFDNPFPPARNPWNLDYVPSGSSSGSAVAIAAGLCLGSLGSDTGGSIRAPASACGIVGLKPTYGLVSRFGVVPLSWSLDHTGPMTRTVEDCALLLQGITVHDPRDPASAKVAVPDYLATIRQGVRGLRLGVPGGLYNEAEGTDPEVRAAVDAAFDVLQDLGATVVDIDSSPFVPANNANTIIIHAEAYAYHEQNLKNRPGDFGSYIRSRFYQGAFLSAADYIQAQRTRTTIISQIGDILKAVDALVMPTTAQPPSTFTGFDPDARFKVPSFTGPFNLTGMPAISVPCGFTANGLPIGMQIAARAFDDATVLRIAYAYEQATSWHKLRPSI